MQLKKNPTLKSHIPDPPNVRFRIPVPRILSDTIFYDFVPPAKIYHRRIASYSRTASFRIHMTHQDSSGDQEWPVRM